MYSITLEQAIHILRNATALVVDDDAISYPSLNVLNGDDENEFMYISWFGEKGGEYSTRFREGENRTVQISGSSMFLTDYEGVETQITILVRADIAEMLNL